MKEALFKATELNVNVRFYPVEEDEYNHCVAAQGKHRYILTVLSRHLTARQMEA